MILFLRVECWSALFLLKPVPLASVDYENALAYRIADKMKENAISANYDFLSNTKLLN